MQEDTSTKVCKTIGRIVDIIILAIFLILIIGVIAVAIQKVVNKNDVPNVFGYTILQVKSGSMSGVFETGDTIIIKNIKDENSLKVGDIVAFKVDSKNLVAHRIIAINEENGVKHYTTKGDANNTQDQEQITFQNIEGQYLRKATVLGVIIKIMQNPVGLAVIIAIPILVIWRINSREKTQEEKQEMRRKKRLKYEEEHSTR